ncbi:ABC transporter ATP-binding protein [Kiritimatiellota bacterium B12222]|nr:ABC transporter ATP-binding protein [Kiritimatiellota bacterium B12222]
MLNAPSPSLAIQVKNVALSYPKKRSFHSKGVEKFWALKEISFDIPEGTILGIVGENGAGKSTLLSLLAGILKPDQGSVLHQKGLRTTLLSLQAGFSPHLTGRDNIRISGLLLGMSKTQVEERMEAMVSLADIGPFIDQPLRTYSTGMKARLGFATAYHTDADVMLLDEVFAVGDLDFSNKAQALMEKKINDDKTVVMVSHGEYLLKQLCENLVWIKDGVIAAHGPTQDVWEAYQHGK